MKKKLYVRRKKKALKRSKFPRWGYDLVAMGIFLAFGVLTAQPKVMTKLVGFVAGPKVEKRMQNITKAAHDLPGREVSAVGRYAR